MDNQTKPQVNTQLTQGRIASPDATRKRRLEEALRAVEATGNTMMASGIRKALLELVE